MAILLYTETKKGLTCESVWHQLPQLLVRLKSVGTYCLPIQIQHNYMYDTLITEDLHVFNVSMCLQIADKIWIWRDCVISLYIYAIIDIIWILKIKVWFSIIHLINFSQKSRRLEIGLQCYKKLFWISWSPLPQVAGWSHIFIETQILLPKINEILKRMFEYVETVFLSTHRIKRIYVTGPHYYSYLTLSLSRWPTKAQFWNESWSLIA